MRHRVVLFVEDSGHESFLTALLARLAEGERASIELLTRSARGGYGKVVQELVQYIGDIRCGREHLPEVLVVGADSNCIGVSKRAQALREAVADNVPHLILAIPDPHIERWLLQDSAAFKASVGKGCDAPDQKCEKDRYKTLLQQAVRNADREPLIGGLEYAVDIARNLNLSRIQDVQLREFVQSFRKTLRKLTPSSRSI
jgi:hypothetical protein